MDMTINDVEKDVRIKCLETELAVAQKALLGERLNRIQAEMGQCQGMIAVAQIRLPLLQGELTRTQMELNGPKDGTSRN